MYAVRIRTVEAIIAYCTKKINSFWQSFLNFLFFGKKVALFLKKRAKISQYYYCNFILYMLKYNIMRYCRNFKTKGEDRERGKY